MMSPNIFTVHTETAEVNMYTLKDICSILNNPIEHFGFSDNHMFFYTYDKAIKQSKKLANRK